MSIASISVNSFASNSAVGSIPSTSAEKSSSGQNQQPSVTVTLSEQAQKLGQTNTQAKPTQTALPQNIQSQTSSTVNTTVNPNAVPQSPATNAAPGIQFISGERKTGRVNTFA